MKDFTVASTTDSLEDVQVAAGMLPEPEQPEVETVETPSEAPPEPETAPAPDTGTTERPKGKGRFEKRISELTRERYEARAEADRLREELEALQRQSQQTAPKETPKPVEGKPLRSSFQNDEEWVEAMSAWKAESLINQRLQAEAERQRQIAEQEILTEFQVRANEFLEDHPDYNHVIGAIRLPENVAFGVQNALMEMDGGVEIGYYLGQHPEICQELSEMSPARAVAELGVISATMFAPKVSPKPAARVPAPITPVGGSSRTARDPGEMTYQEYKRWRRESR